MTPEDVLFKLGELQPDEIARLMKDSGIRAVRESGYSCAVTEFMYKETDVTEIYTGVDKLNYFTNSTPCRSITIDIPLTVRGFIDEFDLGFYPELDAMSPENQEG